MAKQKLRLFKTYTHLYYWNRDSNKRFVVNQGGTSSSKTYSINQVLCKLAIEDPGCVITVVAKTANALERGSLRDFKKQMGESALLRACIKDPSLMRGPYRFHNGSELEFVNLNDPQTARHGKRKYLFLNEANTIDYEAARQLMIRTSERIFIDYNPDAKFWVHAELVPRSDCDFFVSNFTHNQYCPEQTIDDLMDYKFRWQESIVLDGQGNVTEENTFWKNKWYVYGLGLTGVIEGVVFQNVEYIVKMPQMLRKRSYALDFGFKNDPTAFSLIGIKPGSNIYAKELVYEKGLTTPDIMTKFKLYGIQKTVRSKKKGLIVGDLVIADSANQDAIAQMQRAHYNVIPCVKGPGSVKAGIEALRACNIFITRDSKNWLLEQQNYKYKLKQGGFSNEPVDKHNHLWDGMRYWFQHHFPRKARKRTHVPRRVKIINNSNK